MVEEILIDQNKKFDEISKLKPGTKGWKSGTGWQAAERSSVLRAARDYALYGKENLDALTEGSFPGKKYWELGGRKRPDTPHTGMKEQIKRQMKTKVKELIDEFMSKHKDLKEFEEELKKVKKLITPGQVGEA